jgi:hypothetical protein
MRKFFSPGGPLERNEEDTGWSSSQLLWSDKDREEWFSLGFGPYRLLWQGLKPTLE